MSFGLHIFIDFSFQFYRGTDVFHLAMTLSISCSGKVQTEKLMQTFKSNEIKS